MRVGICGGTFDPLHLGHAALVCSVLNSGLVDRVLVIPSGTPPHKQRELVSLAAYRFEMARCAFADDERIEVSDIEILRQGPSYTLDTARILQQQQPQDSFSLVYGSDVLRDIERWHQPTRLLAEWPLLLADRGGVAGNDSRRLADSLKHRLNASITFFATPTIELSATHIRSLAAAEQPINHLVPPKVADFITHQGLYRYQDELAALDPQIWDQLRLLEQALWPLLTRKRLLHALNVLHYALHLAVLHKVDPQQVALAAILHDCAKCLPQQQQLALARQAGDKALLQKPLTHGPAGAILARDRFSIMDDTILHAIHCHTTGCVNMNQVDQIIFIADKVEPARTYANLDAIRALAEVDLDRATRLCLQEIDAFLKREVLTEHPYANQAMRDMEQRILSGAKPSDDEKTAATDVPE